MIRTARSLLAAAAMLLPPAGAAAELPPDLRVDLMHPPGRLVDIGGYRLHLHCRGSGTPAVIFDAGLGGFSLDWIFVQALLEREVRVCAYDRAGYGWSDVGPAPRDSDHIVNELELLLHNAGIAPPWVLVGHSFGGYNVELFALHHPREVAGLVLVESSHPEQAERLPQLPSEARELGSGTLISYFNPSAVFRYYPEEYRFTIGGIMSSGKALRAQQRELRNFTVSAAQVRMGGTLPRVPLVVVTRGLRVWDETPLGDALERTWTELQRELVHGIPGGRQIIARRSGHMVHLDEPETVADAVRMVLREHCLAAVAPAPPQPLNC